jgi:hypothetical protein
MAHETNDAPYAKGRNQGPNLSRRKMKSRAHIETPGRPDGPPGVIWSGWLSENYSDALSREKPCGAGVKNTRLVLWRSIVRLLRIGRPATTIGIHRIVVLSLPNFNRLLLGYLRPAYGTGAPAEKEDPDKSKEGKIRRDGRVEGTLHGYRVCWHDSSQEAASFTSYTCWVNCKHSSAGFGYYESPSHKIFRTGWSPRRPPGFSLYRGRPADFSVGNLFGTGSAVRSGFRTADRFF